MRSMPAESGRGRSRHRVVTCSCRRARRDRAVRVQASSLARLTQHCDRQSFNGSRPSPRNDAVREQRQRMGSRRSIA